MDTAKAVADNCGAAVVIVPTTASTDAPAMGLSVIYSRRPAHHLCRSRHPGRRILMSMLQRSTRAWGSPSRYIQGHEGAL